MALGCEALGQGYMDVVVSPEGIPTDLPQWEENPEEGEL